MELVELGHTKHSSAVFYCVHMSGTEVHVLLAINLFINTDDVCKLSKSCLLRDVKTDFTIWITMSTAGRNRFYSTLS